MSRLIKPSEYAKECGVSRQAIYAKIKKGLLKAKKVDGQIFIELDSSVTIDNKNNQTSKNTPNTEAHKDLLQAKDETINILKNTIKDLKDTNNLIVGTLKGEVDLLKEAFGEMQQLYRTQIEHLKINEPPKLTNSKDIEVIDSSNYIEIKDLAKDLNLNKKDRKKFIRAAKELQVNGDFRFVEANGEVYALKSASYEDFLEALKSL